MEGRRYTDTTQPSLLGALRRVGSFEVSSGRGARHPMTSFYRQSSRPSQ